MTLYKTVISLFVLQAYVFGFAHSLIPHCQEATIEEQQTIAHHHHRHKSNEKALYSEHEHIVHERHYDENIYDLIICFLEEMHRPSDDCNVNHYIPSNTNEGANAFAKAKLVAVLSVPPRITGPSETASTYSDIVVYVPPLLDHSLQRGPPVISC